MNLADALRPIPIAEGARDPLAELDSERYGRIFAAKHVLVSLLASSPYLAECARCEADWLDEVLSGSADKTVAGLTGEVEQAHLLSPADIVPVLKRAKTRMALVAGLAELGAVWTTEKATLAMSHFADAVLHAALGSLVAEAAVAGRIALHSGAHPADNCGLALFALGKLGGEELNFSSDVDIVAFFDVENVSLSEPSEAGRFYTRLMQKLVGLLEAGAGGAFVFRVDLRLRPDPSSTPVAISTGAALQYYESRGQSWERAAWIKARVAAGDHAVGEAFLAELAPFVWRKHLDYATVADVQAMKRQIDLVRRIGDEEVAGHNVKLGRGGIREIEFFAQTQMLIAAGRNRDLRARSTTEALRRLAANGWITDEAAEELVAAYWYLRGVENRLQMRENAQVHILPESNEECETIAYMMGEESLTAFKRSYRYATARVRSRYAALFTEATSLSAVTGNLVFTGREDDPATLNSLEQMGFADPEAATRTIRTWLTGRYPATRTAEARAKLTVLLPALLQTLSEAGNADAALLQFDAFLARLPAGVQLFSLLQAHDYLRRLLVDFMASAPRLSEAVIHRAHIMDGLIDPAFPSEINRRAALVGKVDGFLAEAQGYEDLIDRTHLIGQEQKFLISAGLLSGTIDAANAGRQFTALAETLLHRLFATVREEFAIHHGTVPDARVALLAFGKMASVEMTATSDLDFILLYSVPPEIEQSDGKRPLAPSHYFARLTQRLIAALSAPTATGVLYEADMRLRPSGNAGPLATSLTGFSTYQTRDAWTWEHLALTRARIVYADAGLGAEIDAIIDGLLATPRDPAKLVGDVVDMRDRLMRDRKPRHTFDLKFGEGGLMDLDFIAQSAQLIDFAKIGLRHRPAPEIFRRMDECGWLPEARYLSAVYSAYSTILQAMSACLIEPFNEAHWTDAFRDLLARLCAAPDFAFLSADVEAMKRDVITASNAWYERAGKM